MLFRELVSSGAAGIALLKNVLYKTNKKRIKGTKKFKRSNGAVFFCSPGFEVESAGLLDET
jgi:hypothetical protein